MPSADTFTIKPIADLLSRWCAGRKSIVDPFARKSELAHYRNDLNPEFIEGGVEAQDFLRELLKRGVRGDCMLLDPPYSPRQMAECYQSAGLSKGKSSSQNAKLYSECKDLMTELAAPGAVALTFGWSSVGFGAGRGWTIREILLVCHGAAHNDTICVVEERSS